MKGESAADELAAAKLEAPKVFKKVAQSQVHEINLGQIPTARVVAIKKAG